MIKKVMSMKSITSILSIVFLILVSCVSTEKQTNQESKKTQQEVTNTTWELVELEGNQIDQSKMNGKNIQIILNQADHKITGFSGCNHFNGNYNLENGYRLRFSEIASTTMTCPNSRFNESQLLEALNMTDNFRIQNKKLYLNVGKRAPLAVFKKIDFQEKIVGKYWKLTKLEDRDIKMTENQEREIYFSLKNVDQKITGFAGCNTMSGKYKLIGGNKVSFSKIGVTMKLCPNDNINESKFLKVFELAKNYTIHNDKLSLNDKNHKPLATFEAVYF